MAYQDMSSNWFYKKPVLAADFNQLGENDEILKANADALIPFTYKIETGTIGDGETIPLPSGWTQIDFAFVSLNTLDGVIEHGKLHISVSPLFLVRCYYQRYAVGATPIHGIANYIIFGR